MSRVYWKQQFDKHPDAEGVDFVGLMDKPWDVRVLYATKTKSEMMAGCSYPRGNWLFWKHDENGKRVYIKEERHMIKPGSTVHYPEHKIMFMIVDEDEINFGAFDNRQIAEEIAMSLYEEAAYEMALDLLQWHYHWDMERASREAWERIGWLFQIREFDTWSF